METELRRTGVHGTSGLRQNFRIPCRGKILKVTIYILSQFRAITVLFFFYTLIKIPSVEICAEKDRHGNFSPAVEIPKHLCWHAESGSGSPNCQPCGGFC